jgi:hypothetical protein
MKLLSKIYLILTLDCEQSAKLTSDAMDRRLDWSEQVAAVLHRMICAKSRKLHAQLNDLNLALEKSISRLEHLPDLSAEARRRMLENIGKR